MTVPGGGFHAIPAISSDDVGEITAQVVLRKDLGGKRIRLTGPEAFTFPEAAQRMAAVCGKDIKHMAIPLTAINMVSLLLLPFMPFVRYLYQSLKMLNNFPKDLADGVPNDHQYLREMFDYQPVTLDMEIKRKVSEGRI